MILRILARLSLAFNVVLAGLVGWAVFARHGADAPFSVAQQLTNRAVRVRRVVQESAPTMVAVNAPFHWSAVESADYRVYMANLRAIGCPERTVRDIIVADVDQLFVARLRERFYPFHRQLWWMAANQDQAKELADKVEKDWDALIHERKAVLKALIGQEEPYADDSAEESAVRERTEWARTLDFLTPDKQERVLALRKATQSAIHQLWEADPELTKEERQQRQQQQRELEVNGEQQLAELLTPGEFAEYRLRTSDGANVRHRWSRIQYSEDELRSIARLSNERRELEGRVSGDNPESRRRRMEIAQQTDAQIKETLGETRFVEYQRASDNRFEPISQVVERYGLPDAKATAVYDLLREAEAQARQVREDASRPVAERTALLQAVRDETERSLATELGPQVLATYRKRGGEGWFQSLAAPPK